eukprot:GFUD01074946.1.p1 GENE.GFUD01074946.1~~GFUD01074946.1.p1  ORF type:complete len:140 (-),score=13.85 GFUD01074946.1:122-541(-)
MIVSNDAKQKGVSKLSTEERPFGNIVNCAMFWSAMTGPWAGVQAAASQEETQFILPAVCTLIFFFSSLLLVVSPDSRFLSQLWIIVGLVWLASGWFTFLSQNFTDKSEVWMNICLTQTLAFAFTAALPVLITDLTLHSD